MRAATRQTSDFRMDRFPILLLLLEAMLVLCWSSGFVGVRFASDHAPILTILLWRSVLSCLVLLPFALFKGPRITPRAFVEQTGIGALAMFGYLGGYSLAIGYGAPTGLVALIADMVPLAVAVLSLPVLGLALSWRQWIGIIIGFLGVLVVAGDAVRLGDAPWYAYLLPVAGMASLALATVVQKRLMKVPVPLHQSLFIQSLSTAVLFAVVASGNGALAPPLTPEFVGGIAWLVVFATFGGYGIYFLCLRWSSPARVSCVLYLSPPVTMLWAWAMFDELLSLTMLVGVLISLFGIALVNEHSSSPR